MAPSSKIKLFFEAPHFPSLWSAELGLEPHEILAQSISSDDCVFRQGILPLISDKAVKKLRGMVAASVL